MSSIQSRVLLGACALIVPLALACEPAAEDPATEPVPAEEPAPAPDAPPPQLEATADGYIAAWNGNDPVAVARYFTEDATATVGGDTFRGRTEIQEGWLQNVPLVTDLEVTETGSDRVGDEWRSRGTYRGTIDPPDAEPLEQTGRYSTTWVRDADGEWRIRSTEVQADEPPQG